MAMAKRMPDLSDDPPESHRVARSLRGPLLVSIVNQGVSSGTNFILGAYLARTLTPREFGLYGIGFALALFYSGFGNSLFLTQMVVNSPDKPLAERDLYAASIGASVAAFSLATLLVAALACGALAAASADSVAHRPLGFAIAAASVAYLAKEYFSRHAYVATRESWSLAIHTAAAAALTLTLVVLRTLHVPLTAAGALWVYAACHLVGAAVGQCFARIPLGSVSRQQVLRDCRDVWVDGRWAAATQAMYSLRTQAHVFVAAWGIGPTGVAHLNAGRLLVTPAVMIIPALSQVFVPRLAALRAGGTRGVIASGVWFSSILIGFAVAYSVVLLSTLGRLAPLVLGPNYSSLFGIVLAWCFVSCFLALRSGGDQVLQALKRFRTLSTLR